MNEVLPGILEKEWGAIERELEILKPFARSIHIDLLDGKFAPNTSFLDPMAFKKYSDYFFFELHMMVEEPEQYLESFAAAGFKRFIGHIEKMKDPVSFVAKAQLLGEVGLAIDGPTPVDKLKVNLDDLDSLLVMTIKAGFSGQSFDETHLDKVRKLRNKTNIPIEVDGGVNDITLPKAKEAGANRFVSTSFIFKSEESKERYEALCKLAI